MTRAWRRVLLAGAAAVVIDVLYLCWVEWTRHEDGRTRS